MLLRFLKDKSGATAIEYGLILAVLSLVIIGGIGLVADGLQTQWGDNNAAIGSALSST